MPSLGLTIPQMLHSLSAMGFEPVLIHPRSRRDAIRQIYYYIESGIPVILSLAYKDEDFHAVTVVGHGLEMMKSRIRTETRLVPDKNGIFQTRTFCRSSDLVSHFLVQDDDGGPFRKLYFAEGSLDGSTATSSASAWHVRLEGEVIDPEEKPATLDEILVPFPAGIVLEGKEAENRALEVAATITALAGEPMPNPCLLRTFLILSNNYKEQWRSPARPVCVGRHVRRHLLSRWIWVTEMADLQNWYPGNRAIGEIVQDAAGYTVQLENKKDILLFHTPHLLNLIYPNGLIREIQDIEYKDYLRLNRTEVSRPLSSDQEPSSSRRASD